MQLDRAAQLVWDYHHVGHALAAADCIVVLGSHDLRVAERGAELFLAGWAPWILFTGHLGSLTRALWNRPEAEIFAARAAELGVPRERMLIEDRAANTGENVRFTRELLERRGLPVAKAIAVQKPYMERRTLATFQQLWPQLQVIVTSPQVDLDAYPNAEISRREMVEVMVGDLQRLIVYADRGWSVPQEIPAEVMEAYRALVAAGYTKRLVREGR